MSRLKVKIEKKQEPVVEVGQVRASEDYENIVIIGCSEKSEEEDKSVHYLRGRYIDHLTEEWTDRGILVNFPILLNAELIIK